MLGSHHSNKDCVIHPLLYKYERRPRSTTLAAARGPRRRPPLPVIASISPPHTEPAHILYMFYIGPDLCAREGGFLRVELSLISAYYCGTWNRQDASLSEHPVCALVLQPPVQAHARRSRGREGREGSGEL